MSAYATDSELIGKIIVTNTGKYDGTEVIQMYVGFENSFVDRPVKQLRGFKRISLDVGESKEVMIRCPLEKLKYYEPTECKWYLEHMNYNVYMGNSSATEALYKTVVCIHAAE